MGKKLSTEICFVGNQRNRLSGTVPMGTQNKSLNDCLTIFWNRHIFYRHFDTSVGKKLSTKICVVGNKWNRLNEMVPMSVQNKC